MTYRPEVDGLRAVAVLAVLLFHAGGLLPGGFAGVDVFFVISGYVITSVIARELDDGRFSIAGFYERRVRRIAPALLATIVLTAAASAFVLLPPDLDSFGESAMAATLMVSNVHFWLQAGYFDAESLTKPLLHTWSLGIEEQFYLLYPLLIGLMWRRARRLVAPVLAALFALSLVASVWAVAERPAAAFFLAPFRFWELFLGGLVALRPVPKLVGSPLAFAGLLMIGASYLVYDAETVFPGLNALLPTVGAALFIAAAREGALAARLLSVRPVVFIGKISYSLYLAHWPLIVLIEYGQGAPLGALQAVVVIVASIVLASLSWALIEQPFRRPKRPGAYLRVFGVAGAGAVAACAIGVVLDASDGMAAHMPAQARAAFASAKDVWPDGDRCLLDTKGRAGPTAEDARAGRLCRFGGLGETERPDYLVWGDSHASAMAPSILAAAARGGARGAFVGGGGCPPLPGYDSFDARDSTRRRCRALNEGVMDYVGARKPAVVFLVARWPKYANGSEYGNEGYFFDPQSVSPPSAGEGERLAAALDSTLARLRASGVTPVLVMDVPEPGYDVPYAYARALAQGRAPDLAPTRAAVEARQSRPRAILEAAAGKHGAIVVDPTPMLCDADRCPLEHDGALLYSDEDHISVTGAKRLSGLYDRFFGRASDAARGAPAGGRSGAASPQPD